MSRTCGRWKPKAWAAASTPGCRSRSAARSPTACGTSRPRPASPWSPCPPRTPPGTAPLPRPAAPLHRTGPAHPDGLEVGPVPGPGLRVAGRPRPGGVAAHRRPRPHPPGHGVHRPRQRQPDRRGGRRPPRGRRGHHARHSDFRVGPVEDRTDAAPDPTPRRRGAPPPPRPRGGPGQRPEATAPTGRRLPRAATRNQGGHDTIGTRARHRPRGAALGAGFHLHAHATPPRRHPSSALRTTEDP